MVNDDERESLMYKEQRQREEIWDAIDLVRKEIMGKTTNTGQRRQVSEITAQDAYRQHGVKLAVRSMGSLDQTILLEDLRVTEDNFIKYQAWVRPEGICEEEGFKDWDPYVIISAPPELEGDAAKQSLLEETRLQHQIDGLEQTVRGVRVRYRTAAAAHDIPQIREIMKQQSELADQVTKLESRRKDMRDRRLGLGAETRVLNEEDTRLQEIRADCSRSKLDEQAAKRTIDEILRCYEEQRAYDKSTFKAVNIPWNQATGKICTMSDLIRGIWTGNPHVSP
jgi:hypothetical protein